MPDTKVAISYITNQYDTKIPDNEVWHINFNLYICATSKKNENDTAVYDINVSHSDNKDLHFVLAHIENDILYRTIVPRNTLSQSMTIHWARNKVKIHVEGGFQITIDQLDRNLAQVEIPLSVVQQFARQYSIAPTNIIPRILEVPAVDIRNGSLMHASHKLYPQLKGSCKFNCGKFHGK